MGRTDDEHVEDERKDEATNGERVEDWCAGMMPG